MPKYVPTYEDLYSTKSCAICGRDVIYDDQETCCELCQQQWESFQEDWEWFQWKDFEENPDENLSGW